MSLPVTGYLVDSSGNVVAHVHGFVGTPPSGQTFVEDPTLAVTVGQPAPTTFATSIATTDNLMARGAEDMVLGLINKGLITWSDLPTPLRTHINTRRALRGQSAV